MVSRVLYMSSFDKLPVTIRTFLLSVQVGDLPKLSGSPEQFIKWHVLLYNCSCFYIYCSQS